MTPIVNSAVAHVFAAWPQDVRDGALAVRQLILDTAEATPGVGRLSETLKWGEPAYLTEVTRSGSTIRLGWKARNSSQYALLVNCKTNLIDTFRALFPDEFIYEGQRAILFDVRDAVPTEALSVCIAAALTYHLRKV